MLDKIVGFALRERLFVLVIAAALVVAGVRAFLNLPIEAFPDVQDVQVQVISQWPGQAPEEVERAITQPVERAMSGVPHMSQLRSVSITGLSVVTMTFSEKTDDYFARQQVLERLGNADLPDGVQPTLAPLTTAVGEVYRYILEGPHDLPVTQLRAVQDWIIAPTIRMVPGVADVNTFGGAVREIQVDVAPAQLARYALRLDDVADAVTKGSGNAGGGWLRYGDEAQVVRSVGNYRTLDDLMATVIASPGGQPVRVGDVATVKDGKRPRSGIVAFNDRDDVIEGIVVMTKGQSAAEVVARIVERVDALNEELAARGYPGVKLVPVYKRTDLIAHTVHTVAENLIVGAVLIVAILILFLRNWRAALVVAAVIPLSLLFAFLLIDLKGVSANLISLGAVDFGIIVDGAVVLVEALMVRFALGQAEHGDHVTPHPGVAFGGPWRVATLRRTVLDMGRPILFAKAIIICAFLPIFTFQRVEGKIFAPVALTLSFALLGALILTMTLVPTLLSFIVQKRDMAETHSEWLHKLQQGYRRWLEAALGHKRKVMHASLVVLALTLASVPFMGSEFLPKLDEGNLWLTVSLPPQTALDKTKEIEREVRRIIRGYPEVGDVITQVGRTDDGTDPKGPNNLEVLAQLKPRGDWRFGDKKSLIADMTTALRRIPGLQTNFSQVIEDNVAEALSGVKGEISIKVTGPDLAILEDQGQRIADIVAGIRGAADVSAIRIGGQAEIDVVPDRARLARYGLGVADVNALVDGALAGKEVSTFYDGEKRFDIVMRVAGDARRDADALRRLPLALPSGGDYGNGATVALGDVADVVVRTGAARIGRERGERSIAVKANLLGRDQGSFVKEAQQKVAAEIHLPPGYRMTWGGQFENQQRAMKRLAVIVPISFLAIFALLFWAFRSIRNALIVLAMTPFTLVGAVAGLWLARLNLSVSAAVGLIAVVGISVQNGVIMIEQMTALMREGKHFAEAIVEGAVERLRPVLMTALMAGLGLLPAALSHGIGSETQRPFATVIVGGIVSATVFTLFLLPVLYRRFGFESDD
ncbi:efflux RND transporter permease subunit [Derxia gummosa]|uniref:Efflux RND transporter permease subunit n=1 Tax=Derxia gummosa DSM 723 TaxID=1121388 RepID=A0A8B6X2A8_9BURK|nr:CusA/CzcA family heavy metal efflux RND transporter [Derxia gummosa]